MENEGKRLNKFISDSGFSSRREADRLILEGRVELRRKNRKNEPVNPIEPAHVGDRVFHGDTVYVDGKELPKKEAKRVYLMLNKPAGIICTGDPSVPNNVIDYLGAKTKVSYAGRLDKDSSGLLVLTNDGDLIEGMMHAAKAHEKEYTVTVDKRLTQEFADAMRRGVKIRLDDDRNKEKAAQRGQRARYVTTRPCRLKLLDEKTFLIVLTQGYNRQIRRMCGALGYSVKSIRRVRIMNLRLGDLKVGESRPLTREEVDVLRRQCGLNG